MDFRVITVTANGFISLLQLFRLSGLVGLLGLCGTSRVISVTRAIGF
jgi:hypothetical protein